MCPKWFLFLLTVFTLWVHTGGSVEAQAEKQTVFVNVNLVPMTDESIIADQTVLVKGTQITAVGLSSAIDIPENSIIIDGSTLYLMPGLADMHIHTDTRWLSGGWPVSPCIRPVIFRSPSAWTVFCLRRWMKLPIWVYQIPSAGKKRAPDTI